MGRWRRMPAWEAIHTGLINETLEEEFVTNLEKVKNAGVNVQEMSPEEKQVVETLSPEEMDTLLKAKGKYDQITKGKAPVTSLKIL
jgi:isochorismate hydrolase